MYWCDYPQGIGYWHYIGHSFYAPITDAERAINYCHPGYDISAEMSEADSFRAIINDFTEFLKEYFVKMRQLATERNWGRTPIKRELEHFKWYVYRKIKKWSPAKIALHFNVCQSDDLDTGRKTIENGINSVAEIIRLPIPPSRKGRPKKL